MKRPSLPPRRSAPTNDEVIAQLVDRVRAVAEGGKLAGRSAPLAVVAIGGTAATGKTTLAERLASDSGIASAILATDGYMMERAERRASGITGPNPRAHDLVRLGRDLAAIARGESTTVLARVQTEAGRVSREVPFEPRPLVIVEGLVALYPEVAAQGLRFDLSIFLDGPPDDELAVRLVRDVQERKHPRAEVESVFWLRQSEYDLYLRPTGARADVRLWAERVDGRYGISIVSGPR